MCVCVCEAVSQKEAVLTVLLPILLGAGLTSVCEQEKHNNSSANLIILKKGERGEIRPFLP